MKTSRIIFISLLGSVALLILAAAIDIRLSGHRINSYTPDRYQVNRTAISDYKVLSLSNCSNIDLTCKDSASLEIICPKDSLLPKLNYILKGDTLIINDSGTRKDSRVLYKVQATGSLRQIVLKNSDVNLENHYSAKLSLDLDRSSINLNKQGFKAPKMSSLKISAMNHSVIETGEINVDSMNLQLKNSEAYLDIKAARIYGTLSDSSKLSARQPFEVFLRKDSTSSMSLNEY